MSLDVHLKTADSTEIYSSNITHNLNTMAEKAGIYEYLWRPEELNITMARELIEPLREGLQTLLESPDVFKVYNPKNKWGSYEGLVTFVRGYLKACEENPESYVEALR